MPQMGAWTTAQHLVGRFMLSRRSVLRRSLLAHRFACVAVLLVLAGCSGTNESREVALRWLDALNSQDPDKVLVLLAPTATYVDPTTPVVMTPQTLRPWLRASWDDWKERRYTPGAIVATPESVVIEWRLAQTHVSGTSVPIQGITLIEHKDGRIQHVRDYYNAAMYLQFLKS